MFKQHYLVSSFIINIYRKHCLLKVLHRLMNISSKFQDVQDHILLLTLMETNELDSPFFRQIFRPTVKGCRGRASELLLSTGL